MTDWQPIDTAPKDGTSVLVSCEGDVHEAKYHPDNNGWWLANSDPTDYWDGQVWPDLWTPMPAPPAVNGEHTSGGKDAED